MNNITLTEEFNLAYRFITETNLNIFLTGKAGTGKTTFLKHLRENSIKKMVVAAPTGVAAINAGGVTLHSLFQLPFAPFVPSNASPPALRRSPINSSESPFGQRRGENENAVNGHSLLSKIRFNKEKLNLFRNLELLVIDEASMVASHTVDAIDTILRSVKRKHNESFGGTQVLFIGDLHQLPPVVKNQEWEFLKNYYPSIFFFDSIVLRENIPVMVELKKIFRQQDSAFINVLNEIRNNNLTPDNFALLNSRLKRNYVPKDGDGYITLTTHNYQSDEINKKKLKQLSARSYTYTASIQGDFREHLFPAEPKLELKAGSQVMFLKNDVEGKRYFNGKIGIITALDVDIIKVKCKGEAQEIEVKKQEWKNVNYSLNPETREITEEELGSFLQYPLRLAWAITIHKSQGLTFDKLIIDAENAFANGQVYVALSRCTALEGLILTSPVNQKFLGAHHNLKEWQEKNQDEKNIHKKFDYSRLHYILQEVQNVFTWKNWYYELRNLSEMLNEEKENLPAGKAGLPSGYFSWITELNEKQKKLYEVSEKFKERIIELCNQTASVEENQTLQKRIKEAAYYFSTEIIQWKENFFAHPLTTGTKKTARKIDASLNEINIIIHEILHKIDYCKNGFILNDYLNKGKKFTGTIEKIQSSYEQNQSSNRPIADGTMHEELYIRIAELRKQIVRKTNLPLYTVFSNKTIQNVCTNLPGTKDALLNVSGFGKAKVEKYGNEVLELVLDYCKKNNLLPQEILIKKRERKRKQKAISNPINKQSESFFNPPLYNNLPEQSKQNLQKTISQLPVLRPDSEITNPYITEQRKIFKRAYEPWTEKEEVIFTEAIKHTNDIEFLAEVFQRNQGNIKSFVKKKSIP